MSVSEVSRQFPSASAMQDRLTTALKGNGLSADTAKAVSAEVAQVVQTAAADAGGRPDPTSLRGAIDRQISADVEAGTLTQDQADAVTKTFDQLDQQAAQRGGPPPGGAPGGGGGAGGAQGAGGVQGGGAAKGGAGGGSSAEKTEVSSSSTTKGNVTTTVTLYSDGSTETTTSYGPSGKPTAETLTDLLQKDPTLSAEDKGKAGNYLAALLSDSWVDTKA